MALHGIEAVLFLVLFHLSLLVAHASGLWYLLVPPADYSTATHRYTSLADAPLGRWYHDGEYGSERVGGRVAGDLLVQLDPGGLVTLDR